MPLGEGVAQVSDASLQPLRDHEAQLAVEWQEFLQQEERAAKERARRKKSKRPAGRANRSRAYVLGQRVRVLDPAFGGLTATVHKIGRKELAIVFDDKGFELKIEACDIEPFAVSAPLSEVTKAA
jgi:preprotein translocase subunit YajC